MRRWLSGQALLMLIHGASATLAFGLLHLHYFYLLGVFAGVINIIPVLGPVLTVVAAGLVAATQGLTKVLGAVIFFVVYHNLENVLLTPRIMSKETHLPAVTILVALVIVTNVLLNVALMCATPRVTPLRMRFFGAFLPPAAGLPCSAIRNPMLNAEC